MVSSINGAAKLAMQMEINETTFFLSPVTKIHPKWMKDPNLKLEII
jgi:hypothetical protein